uniref:Retrotransposon gag domain-containing protein n=1 Tax=Fagus sylvatica TaxID=28930 RepID=A0A2N9IAN8_FAGSY
MSVWVRNSKGRLETFETLFGSLFDTPTSSPTSSIMAEERVIPPEAPRMTMYQLLHPTQSSIPSCIMFPPNAPHVEIKQGLMAILPDFRGLENENPYVHVRAFEEVIGSFYAQNMIETAKLRFFPFSLKDKAKGWLYTLKPRSIGSWGEMTQEFYKKFFPPHKVQQVKRKISNFAQGNDETLFMAWERFKDTYNFCPTHGYDTWRLEPEDAMDYLNEIAENSNTWNGPSPLDSTNRNRSSTTTSGGSVFRLREEDNMNAKISLLTKEIEALKLKGSRGVNAVYREDPMEACQDLPRDRSYHKCMNFDTSHTTSSSSRLPLEDVLYTFIQKQGEQNQRFDTMFTRIDEEMRETKSQVARLTEALSRTERGKLPSQTQPNPNNQTAKVVNTEKFEEVKSITILRSGKEIGKDAPKANEKSKETSAEKDESGITKSNDIEKYPFPTPFPQALKLPKNLDVTNEILEHLDQVKVNLPLLHLIKQMPLYAKVIKDLCTVKRKHHVKKTAFLTKQVSAIIQHKIPPKYKDLGCPTISCTIGDYNIERALLDLGASVNLLPFSIHLQLGLGELKPTSVTLQLADRSVRKPRKVVEDVLVKVENFYYPVDFIILDIEPTLHPSANIPIILGRPFLATANALINCRNGRMKITFGSMTAELNIFNVNPQQLVDEECEYVNFIEATPQEEFNKNCFSNSFETLPVNSIVSNELKSAAKIFDYSSLLDSLQILEKDQVVVAKNPPRNKKKSLLAYPDAPKLRLNEQPPRELQCVSIEPHATTTVEVHSKECVDQEVEKAGEKTKFFERHKTKRKVFQDTRLSKKLLNSSKGVALHVARMKSARGSNYSFGGSRSGG